MTYQLKTWPEYISLLLSGEKNFEVRKNDHDFKLADLLILQEWDPATQQYTGRETTMLVSYVLQGGQFGIGKDYCIMSLTILDNQKAAS